MFSLRYELRQLTRALCAVLGDVDDAGGHSSGDNQRTSRGSRRAMVTGWWRGEAEQLLERLRQVEPV